MKPEVAQILNLLRSAGQETLRQRWEEVPLVVAGWCFIPIAENCWWMVLDTAVSSFFEWDDDLTDPIVLVRFQSLKADQSDSICLLLGFNMNMGLKIALNWHIKIIKGPSDRVLQSWFSQSMPSADICRSSLEQVQTPAGKAEQANARVSVCSAGALRALGALDVDADFGWIQYTV